MIVILCFGEMKDGRNVCGRFKLNAPVPTKIVQDVLFNECGWGSIFSIQMRRFV